MFFEVEKPGKKGRWKCSRKYMKLMAYSSSAVFARPSYEKKAISTSFHEMILSGRIG